EPSGHRQQSPPGRYRGGKTRRSCPFGKPLRLSPQRHGPGPSDTAFRGAVSCPSPWWIRSAIFDASGTPPDRHRPGQASHCRCLPPGLSLLRTEAFLLLFFPLLLFSPKYFLRDAVVRFSLTKRKL